MSERGDGGGFKANEAPIVNLPIRVNLTSKEPLAPKEPETSI